MALTNTIVASSVIGNKRMVLVQCQFDSSYPTNGYALAPADVGLSTFDIVLPEHTDGYIVRYTRSTGKLKVRTPVGALAAHTHTGAAHTHTGAAHTHNTDAHTHVTEQAVGYTQNEVSAANTPAAGSSTTPGAGQSTTPGAGSSAGAIVAGAGVEVANATDLSLVTPVAVLIIGN